ncbi:MAG: hypothetical protein U0V70_16135 [Terriglobia bacterium]
MNGKKRNIRWRGRLLDAGTYSGDRMVLTFPITERTVKETIGDVPYTLTIKAAPLLYRLTGTIGLLYNRAASARSRRPFRKANAYPEQTIIW